MKRILVLTVTHLATLAAGFALGVYFLPILVAQSAPEAKVLAAQARSAQYTASLRRDLPGSDALHWAEGALAISKERIVHQGKVAPGPDYKIYLAPAYVEDAAAFEKIKDRSLRVGEVKSFDGFIAELPPGTDIEKYDTVVIWCEAFSKFITAGKYR